MELGLAGRKLYCRRPVQEAQYGFESHSVDDVATKYHDMSLWAMKEGHGGNIAMKRCSEVHTWAGLVEKTSPSQIRPHTRQSGNKSMMGAILCSVVERRRGALDDLVRPGLARPPVWTVRVG